MGDQLSKAAPAIREQSYHKRMKAAELRRLGLKWDEVAAGAGYPSKQTAHSAVRDLLREHQSLAYREIGLYRQESLDRLTDLLRVAMEKALKGDEKMMTQARLIISQIGDLTGEKAPVKMEIGESDVDRLLRDAIEEFRRRTGGTDPQVGDGQGHTAADGAALSD